MPLSAVAKIVMSTSRYLTKFPAKGIKIADQAQLIQAGNFR
jgi:hypothetical protein